MTHLVVSVTGPGLATARAQAREAEALGADLIELRLDLLEKPKEALGMIREARVPVIAKGALLAEADQAGAAWVDLDREALAKAWRPKKAKVLGSHHVEKGIPEAGVVRKILASGAQVAKVVGTPSTLKEARALLDLNALALGRVAAFGMGPRGTPTRMLAGRFGSWAVYAAADFGPAAAPGQIPVSEMLFPLRFREVTGKTALYGLIGSPLSSSPGPWAHTAAMRSSGIDGLYLPLEAADEADARAAVSLFSLSGASVTRPFKEALLGLPGEVGDEARLSGALNTLERTGKGWRGANTDVLALRRILSRMAKGRRLKVAILGRGGLAKAAAEAARTHETVEALGDADVVVQATPAGGWEDPEGMPFDPKELKPGAALVEAPILPLRTRLAREAAKRGHRVVSGFELWLAQALEQFAIWHDQEPKPLALLNPAWAWVSRRERETGSLDPRVRALALSGMRCAGKSTVGRLAAERLGLPFADLDRAIEKEAGMPPAEIFSEEGEAGFRRWETRALARQALSPPGVLALGGGTVTRPENEALLAGFADTVLLDAPVEVLRERLSKEPQGKRPSLTGSGVLEEIEALWLDRKAAYTRTAFATVKAGLEPQAVADRVAALRAGTSSR